MMRFDNKPYLINAYKTEWFQIKCTDGNTYVLIKKKSLFDLPRVDAEPVRHGEWIPLEEPQWNCFGLITIGYRCSECGREEPDNHELYCHCGAKMDGGLKDANA